METIKHWELEIIVYLHDRLNSRGVKMLLILLLHGIPYLTCT